MRIAMKTAQDRSYLRSFSISKPSRFVTAIVYVVTFGMIQNANAEESPSAASVAPVSYHRDVFPILRANCFGCHQPSRKQGGYLMTDFASLLAGGETGVAAVTPGKAIDSPLAKVIVTVDGKAEMPKNGKPLKESEVDLIQRWIDQGAKDDSPVRSIHYSDRIRLFMLDRLSLAASIFLKTVNSLLQLAFMKR